MPFTPEQKEHLSFRLCDRGLEDVFVNYSSFEEVDDPEFHKLRQEFVDAYLRLESYLNQNGIETSY